MSNSEYISQARQLPAPGDKTPFDVTSEFEKSQKYLLHHEDAIAFHLIPRYKPDPVLQFLILAGMSPYYSSGPERSIKYGEAPKKEIRISKTSEIARAGIILNYLRYITSYLQAVTEMNMSKSKRWAYRSNPARY